MKTDLASPRRLDLPSRHPLRRTLTQETSSTPSVVAALRGLGLDPSREFPKALADQEAQDPEVVVIMGCGDTCPFYPGNGYLDWELQ